MSSFWSEKTFLKNFFQDSIASDDASMQYMQDEDWDSVYYNPVHALMLGAEMMKALLLNNYLHDKYIHKVVEVSVTYYYKINYSR